MEFVNNSLTTIIEPWFIPLDILMIISSSSTVILAIMFLFVIIIDKACHTVPSMLIANSCLAELIFGSDMLGSAIFALQNDLKQIHYYDIYCIIRGIFGYISVLLQTYSFLLQAIYRYITVVYPNHLFYQSFKFQIFLICCQWIFACIYLIPVILIGNIQYHMNDQICQIPLKLSFIMIYNLLLIFVIPMSLIMLIYLKLFQYVREMNKNITTSNLLSRAKRELKMSRRIVTIVLGVTAISCPYAVMVFIGYFTSPPKYHFRISYIFLDISLAFVMIALLKFTEPVQAFFMKNFNRRQNWVYPTTTFK